MHLKRHPNSCWLKLEAHQRPQGVNVLAPSWLDIHCGQQLATGGFHQTTCVSWSGSFETILLQIPWPKLQHCKQWPELIFEKGTAGSPWLAHLCTSVFFNFHDMHPQPPLWLWFQIAVFPLQLLPMQENIGALCALAGFFPPPAMEWKGSLLRMTLWGIGFSLLGYYFAAFFENQK